MNRKFRVYRKASLGLGVVILLLGLVPLPIISQTSEALANTYTVISNGNKGNNNGYSNEKNDRNDNEKNNRNNNGYNNEKNDRNNNGYNNEKDNRNNNEKNNRNNRNNNEYSNEKNDRNNNRNNNEKNNRNNNAYNNKNKNGKNENNGTNGNTGDPLSGGGGTPTSSSLVLIPVTGVDLSGAVGLQAFLRYLAVFFFGVSMMSEGLARRKTRP